MSARLETSPQGSPNAPTPRPPLDHDELRDVVDLALWAGQMLLRAGAQADRVERTIHQLGTTLGADRLDVMVLPQGLVVTTTSGDEFRTRVRRVVGLSVDLTRLDGIFALRRRVVQGGLDRVGLREELERLERAPPTYGRFVVVLMVGLACAAFSRLFGGDWASFALTFASSSLAMFVRQTLHRRLLNPLLIVMVTAFVAELLPAVASWTVLLPNPEPALAASALLLVPGVPLINAARDILRGHLVTGTALGFLGLVTSLCIALGLMMALQVTGRGTLGALPEAADKALPFVASDWFWAGIAALGFAVLFNAPKRALAACFVAGGSGHALRALLELAHVSVLTGTLLAAVLVGLLGELFGRRLQSPAGVFSVPGAIPMVPGVFAFRAIMGLIGLTTSAVSANTGATLVEAMRNFTLTGLTLGCIAMGIALPSLIRRRETPIV